MKAHPTTLFAMATDILAAVSAERLDRHDVEIDPDTTRHDVYDLNTGRLILSANVFPHNRAIKEILFPTCRLN